MSTATMHPTTGDVESDGPCGIDGEKGVVGMDADR